LAFLCLPIGHHEYSARIDDAVSAANACPSTAKSLFRHDAPFSVEGFKFRRLAAEPT